MLDPAIEPDVAPELIDSVAAGAARVFAAIDARMGEVYFQPFVAGADGAVRPAGEAVVCAPQDVPVQPGDGVATGTGWGSYETLLRARIEGSLQAVDGAALPRAEQAFTLALPVFGSGGAPAADALQPVYLRNRVALTLAEQRQLRQKRD